MRVAAHDVGQVASVGRGAGDADPTERVVQRVPRAAGTQRNSGTTGRRGEDAFDGDNELDNDKRLLATLKLGKFKEKRALHGGVTTHAQMFNAFLTKSGHAVIPSQYVVTTP